MFGSRCGACRSAILSIFTSTRVAASSQSRPSILSRGSQAHCPGRTFSSARPTRSDVVKQAVVQQDASEKHEREDVTSDTSIAHDKSTGPPVPWYLQVETPPSHAHPLSRRQKIPDVPGDAPDIVLPLLEHVSVELGLDDLCLLDLRHLDPPPALGSGLMMVIGTARSERHLHVSADRFCRWLRSNYKLSPVADGLLGRNELKLKLRRKARKARLLGSVGAPVDANADDGIRTGWVCVNVGAVPHAAQGELDDGSAVGFVGFGRLTQDVRLVVQMVTEEKREEIDLEGLWAGALNRKAKQGTRGPGDGDRNLQIAAVEADGSRALSRPVKASTSDGPGLPAHARGLHTLARQPSLWTATEALRYPGHRRLLSSRGTAHGTRTPGEAATTETFSEMSKLEDLEDRGATRERLSKSVDTRDHEVTSHQLDALPRRDVYLDQNRTRALKSHLQDLKARARASAMEMLGTGGDDYSSTNFLFRFYQAIPPFPTHEHWLCRLELYRYGLELGHPGYAKDGLLGLLDEMQLSGAGVPESTFNDVLVAILKRPADSSGVSGLGSLGRADFALAVSVLEAMRRYGFEAMTEDNIIRLHTAIAPLESPLGDSDLMPPPGSPSDRSRPGTSLPPEMLERTRELQARVNRALISDSDLPCPSTPTLIKLMSLHARTENWPGFYDIFSVPARSMLPRQSALYAHMFETVAGTKHEGRCADALRTWAPEMEREVPEVELEGPVAHAVELCLKVVDKTPDAENEWNRLRQKIARARVEGRTLRNDDFLAHQQRDHVELDEERRLAPEDLFGREQALFEYQAEGRAREEDARHQVRVGA